MKVQYKKYRRICFVSALVAFAVAAAVAVSVPAFAAPRDIERTQWEGNRYHGRDYATSDALANGEPLPPIEEVWQVRERGEVGSCTHAVAVKVRDLRKRGYDAIVVVVPSGRVSHTYVLTPRKDGKGYWKLDNADDKVRSIPHIPVGAWFGTIEMARKVFTE